MKVLDGYKTIIGGILHAIWFGIYVYGNITKEYEIGDELQWRGHIIIGVLTGVGLWGKYKKNKEAIHNTFKSKK